MPEVSVIVPVYNVEKYLERCINSIKSQTFRDFEVIFVNDGATDSSAELCISLINGYPNMRMVSKQNGGLSSARLFGLHHAKGKYIVFVDSDDYLAPEYLETLYSNIVDNDADVSMCSYFVDNKGSISERLLPFENAQTIIAQNEIEQLYVWQQIRSIDPRHKHLPSFMWLRMFRRELLTDDLFVNERVYLLEDLAFSILIYKSLTKIAICNKPLYYYCVNAGSLTQKYREDLLQMKLNLFNLISKKLPNDSFEAKERIPGFVYELIDTSLKNYCVASFKSFRNSAQAIRDHSQLLSIVLNTNNRYLTLQFLLIKFAYILHLETLLYFSYSLRLLKSRNNHLLYS